MRGKAPCRHNHLTNKVAVKEQFWWPKRKSTWKKRKSLSSRKKAEKGFTAGCCRTPK